MHNLLHTHGIYRAFDISYVHGAGSKFVPGIARGGKDSAGGASKPPPWMCSFAERLCKDKAGVVLASPCILPGPSENAALEEYSRKITAFYRLIGGADRLFVLRCENDFKQARNMLKDYSISKVYLTEGCIDAYALLHGINKNTGRFYPEHIVGFMAEFTGKCASFLVVGEMNTAIVAINGLRDYLARRGMQGKAVAMDSRFIYDASRNR